MEKTKNMNKNNTAIKIFAAIAYIAMVTVNYLANALPIGGVTTGEASDSFPNLFTPAGVTFSIWGLIYLLLLGYTLYQFGLWQKETSPVREKTIAKVSKLFLLTSIANISWIFAWHNGVIWLSVLIMICLLILLINIADLVTKRSFSVAETVFIRLPFSVYFGWITVATIANITVFLVSLNWDGFGIADDLWTVIVLFFGAVIGIARMLKDRNVFYGLVLVWAYGGIWLKHTSKNGFGGEYSNIITSLVVCIVLFFGTTVFIAYRQLTSKKEKKD